jgi:hypothetical protein
MQRTSTYHGDAQHLRLAMLRLMFSILVEN